MVRVAIMGGRAPRCAAHGWARTQQTTAHIRQAATRDMHSYIRPGVLRIDVPVVYIPSTGIAYTPRYNTSNAEHIEYILLYQGVY